MNNELRASLALLGPNLLREGVGGVFFVCETVWERRLNGETDEQLNWSLCIGTVCAGSR